MSATLQRLREFVVHRVLHLDDTPPRIALGVGLGFLVAWTPTLGLQMILYLILATICRANKVSGLGPIWLTNPLTAVPIYYGNWWVGQGILSAGQGQRDRAEVEAALAAVQRAGEDWSRLGEPEFWSHLGSALAALGVELWLGSVVVGAILGIAGYFVSLRAIVAYRRRRNSHRITEG
jgi:uncharacterized protein (DUF2062 family)